MTTSTLAFVLALVAGALAAPWGADVPRCSLECPIAGSPKLAYQPEMTYTYAYSGKSQVQLKGVEDGVTELQWEKQVELTWISPCDMAIRIKNAKVNGETDPAMSRFLERYPLVVAVSDGRVQHVCTHPEDAPWSINMKKGIASALQNSLPSLSPLNSGLTLTETDVVGKCPTKYVVETEGEKIIVVKEKNHHHCQERYPTPAAIPAPWLKAPLPLEESRSECKQEITNGIYTAIMCEDKNIIRPAYGLYKYVEANQESTLRFISEARDTSAISDIASGDLKTQSLLYDHEVMKDPELAPEVDELMKEICEKTKEAVEHDAAPLVAKALNLLRRVPETIVQETVEKVRGGHYCSDYVRLESIILDALAFVHESGAVKVMVQELESGRATGGRLALYTAALYLTPRPNIEAVEALTPLFERTQPMPTVTLAAATMVHNFCRHTPRCYEEAPIRRIAEILATKVERHCSPSAGEEAEEVAIAALKALGNMGVVTPAVTRAAVSCIETEGVPTTTRVAAAHAFRLTECDRYATEKLTDIVVLPTMPTEVRIAAYLGAIRCAKMEDLEKIIPKINEEKNTQVRGFILSHLLNIQESTSPDRETLRYHLTNYVIPRDFDADIRKYSRNIEMSYFAPSMGIGAGVESNIIYTPESFIPRSVDLNLRTTVEDIDFNLGEVGMRFEGLDPIIKELLGPEGYLRRTSFGNILEDMLTFAQEKGGRIVEHLEEKLRGKRAIDMSTIARFFKKLYGDREAGEVRADMFARIFGREVTYASIAENLKEFDTDRLIESFISSFDDIIPDIENLDINSARAGQMFIDYSLPTIQGTPLKLKLEGTAVVGIKIAGDINIIEFITSSGNVEKTLKLIPSASIEVSGFVGFDCFIAKVGTEIKSTISSANGATINIKKENNVFEVELELPEKMELLNIKAETYLVKAVGERLTKIAPPSMRDVRIKHESCMEALEPMLGLKMCYEMNVPDIFRSNALPLGEPIIAKLYIEKADPSLKGYLMTAAIKNKREIKFVKVNVEAVGASTPRHAEMTFAYTNEEGSHIVSAKIDSSTINAGVWTTLTNEEGYKALDTFVKLNSEYINISRGIKVDLKRTTGEEEIYEVNVFTGRNRRFATESQVMEAKLIKKTNGPVVNVDIICRTKNTLRDFIDLNIEVASDLMYIPYAPVPVPVKLHKMEMEFQTGVGGWKIVSFIRNTVASEAASEHNAVFKIEEGSSEIISVEAVMKTEGRTLRNMIVRNAVSVNIGSETYRATYDLFLKSAKMGIKMEILKPKINLKMVEFEALYKRSGNAHNAQVLIDVPEYMRPIKFETKVEKEEEGKFTLEAALKHGQYMLLQVDGPVTFILTPQRQDVAAEVKVAILDMEPHIISGAIFVASNKQVLALELKNRQESLFAYEWKVTPVEGRKTATSTKLIVPAFIEFLLNTDVMEDNVHISFNTAILPKSESAYRVKGFADVDSGEKKINAEIAWDVDRESNKKIVFDANMISNPSTPGHVSLHGNVIYAGEPYHMKLIMNAEALLESGFELELTTPAQKTIALEANYKIQNVAASTRVISAIRFKNTEEMEHKFSSLVAVEKLEGPYSYAFETKALYESPEGRQTKIETLLKHHNKPTERLVIFKVDAEGIPLTKPLKIEFTIENEESSYVGTCKMHRGVPATIFDWDVKIHPEGGLEAVEFGIDTKAVVELLKVMHTVVAFEEEEIRSMESAIYRYRYSQPTPTSYNVLMKTPSRTMEGEAHISATESGFKFYPNKARTEARYEIGYKAKREEKWGETTSKWEGRIHHPILPKPIQAAVQYTSSEQAMKGTVDLDIFSSSEDKITGTLESTRITENTIRTEVSIDSKVLKVSPKMIITSAIASNTVGFDVEFKKTPSSTPALKVVAKYDMTSARNAVVAFIVETEDVAVFELSGVMKPDETPRCDGLAITAIAYVPVLGKHDIRSRVCKPAFVEVTTIRHGGDKEYTVRFGLQDPDNLEVSLIEGVAEGEEARPIIMAQMKLVDPSMIHIDFAYEREDVEHVQGMIMETLTAVKEAVESWMTEIFSEISEDGRSKDIVFPTAELKTLIGELTRELTAIHRDLMEDGLTPILREIPSFTYINKGLKHMARLSAYVAKRVLDARDMMISTCFETAKGFSAVVFRVVKEAAKIIEAGEVPEAVRYVVEVIRETEVFRFMKREIDAVFDKYPVEIETIKYVVTNVKETLERDIDVMIEKIMEIPSVQRIINWVMEKLTPNRLAEVEANTLTEMILEEFHVLNIVVKEKQLQIEIPLFKPVYSVVQYIKEVINPVGNIRDFIWVTENTLPYTLEDLIWMYYTFIPRQITDLLPPYPRTAIVVGGTEILTFDGLVVRAPRSPCKVLLAAHGSHTLTMSHPTPAGQPELELKTPAATIVIKPDFQVLVDGRAVTRPKETVGKIAIEIKSGRIEVGCPLLKAIVVKTGDVVAVEASGWTFGHVAGLLGANNGEVADDRLTPAGVEASSPRELVAAWQEDKQCSTPQVPRPETTITRVIECETLLGIRSRCNPMVSPKPFIEMCHTATNACAAVNAYRTICHLKGVEEPFPVAC